MSFRTGVERRTAIPRLSLQVEWSAAARAGTAQGRRTRSIPRQPLTRGSRRSATEPFHGIARPPVKHLPQLRGKALAYMHREARRPFDPEVTTSTCPTRTPLVRKIGLASVYHVDLPSSGGRGVCVARWRRLRQPSRPRVDAKAQSLPKRGHIRTRLSECRKCAGLLPRAR
jgi:hypothetical protein